MDKILISFLICLSAVFLLPRKAACEFYKYLDKDGKIHFVDSRYKIPKEYRTDLKTYEEKYDHLSEEERDQRIEEERQKAEELRLEREDAQRELDSQREKEQEKKRLAEEARLKEEKKAQLQRQRAEHEEFLKNFETNIQVVGYGQALVPCTLEYNGKETEVMLLLDTGCTYTTVHKDAVKKLRLKRRGRGKARTAGGGTINYSVAKLDSFKVGPYKMDGFSVTLIENKDSRSPHNGLLGMNFLAGREYTIDYVRRVIRWTP